MDEYPNIVTPPSPRNLRRALRLAGWNVLLLIAGLALIDLLALDVTTSAFERGGTGQINQLAFYDEYVRPTRPC